MEGRNGVKDILGLFTIYWRPKKRGQPPFPVFGNRGLPPFSRSAITRQDSRWAPDSDWRAGFQRRDAKTQSRGVRGHVNIAGRRSEGLGTRPGGRPAEFFRMNSTGALDSTSGAGF